MARRDRSYFSENISFLENLSRPCLFVIEGCKPGRRGKVEQTWITAMSIDERARCYFLGRGELHLIIELRSKSDLRDYYSIPGKWLRVTPIPRKIARYIITRVIAKVQSLLFRSFSRRGYDCRRERARRSQNRPNITIIRTISISICCRNAPFSRCAMLFTSDWISRNRYAPVPEGTGILVVHPWTVTTCIRPSWWPIREPRLVKIPSNDRGSWVFIILFCHFKSLFLYSTKLLYLC